MGVTVQDVINQLIKPVSLLENTVDTLKAGSPDEVVTGVAVAFMPTFDAINQAIELGANLLITHEGLFFSHLDEPRLGENKVYENKLKRIQDSKLSIFRFHDYWHRYQPDGIISGLVQELGWEQYVTEHQPTATILSIPSMTVQEVAEHVKSKLGIEFTRCMGNLSMPCSRIALLAGYRGNGRTAIPVIEKEKLDLVLYGEGPEWETPEYIRDSISQGNEKALIILGHSASEEPGMRYLKRVLENQFPEIPIHFISTSLPFEVL